MSIDKRTAALGVAAGLVVVAAIGAQLTAPSDAVPTPEIVPVVATELVCPSAFTSNDGTLTTQLTALTPQPLVVAQTGRAVIGAPKKPASIAQLSGRSFGVTTDVPDGVTTIVGTAVAGRAPGFAMDQLTVSSGRKTHGLSGATCTEPTNDAWFVGTGSGVGHTSTLYLTDTEATPATVDIALFGPNGRIDAPGGLGVQVGANSRRVVALDALAPGAGVLAVHVTASSGRVGAAVFDSEVRGLEPRGSDWVPVSEEPATRVVVPGLGGGEGSRRLTVFAPGEGTATVNVRLVGQQGSFAPAGAASIDIDRGKVATINLGNAITSDEVSAVLESDVRFVAGVRWANNRFAVPDLAFSAGAPALTAPAVVAGARIGGTYGTTLMFTSLGAASSVTVQPLDGGRPKGKPIVVKIGADRTVRVALPATAKRPFGALITPAPGTGQLYGALVRARIVDRASGITVSVLRNARITVGIPEAQADLEVGLGR